MSAALKCDLCKNLYEADENDNKVTVQEPRNGYQGTAKVIGFLKLFRSRGFRDDDTESIDHCQKCTEKAVLAFMRHFKIEPRYGEELVCYPRKVRERLFFDGTPNAPGTDESRNRIRAANALWFEQFIGKRVRITVEVL